MVTKPVSFVPGKNPAAELSLCKNEPLILEGLPSTGFRKLPLNCPVVVVTFNVSLSAPIGDTVTLPLAAMTTLLTRLLCRLPPPRVNVPLPAIDGPPSFGETYSAPVKLGEVANPLG